MTAIAWAFTDKPRDIFYALLTKDEASYREMLEAFVAAYNQADMVTGHYIRRHDLPILNGALVEEGMPPLAAKLTLRHEARPDRVEGHPEEPRAPCRDAGRSRSKGFDVASEMERGQPTDR